MPARRMLLTAWVVGGLVAPAHAQQEAVFQEIDRVAAIVGNRVIPLSRVLEEINARRQQGFQIPQDSTAFVAYMRQVARELVDQELLVQAAQRDTTVVVLQQDVQSAVDRALTQIRGQFSSDLEFQRELQTVGFGSITEYRNWLAEQQRRDMLVTQLRQRLQERGELAPLQPTEEEMRAYFQQNREQLPRRPATVTFRQIVVRPEGDSAAVARAYELADSLAQELRDGADFAVVARRFSDDPATAAQGGDLGWVRRGRLVPEFERVAFDPRFRPGTISNPVRTVFGFHVIQVQRVEPAEIQMRHVLIAPEITEADEARSLRLADEIATALRGGAPFDSLSALYHDEAGQEQTLVEDFPRGELPPSYRDALATAEPGEILGPVPLEQQGRAPKYAVIVFQNARPAGEYSFDDPQIRDRIRQELADQNAMERYLRTLRRATYIDIRL